MKKKKTKLKALAAASAMVLLMGATAATTWALTNIKMDAGFKIQINGSRNVEAIITGASYKNATKVEDMDTIVLDKNSTSTASATFDETIAMSEVSDVVSYEFTIKNNCDDSSYSNLVIKPSLSITDDYESAVSTFYVSTNGTNYEVLVDEYLTLFTNETIYVKLNVVVPEMLEVVDYTGKVSFDLYSEKYAPAGYKQDYEYSIVDGVGYKAGKSSLGTVASAQAMDASEYVIATPDTAQDVLDSDINGKTVVFDAGTYDKALEFRPSAASGSKAYLRTSGETDNFLYDESNEVAIKDLDSNTHYVYVRNYENVTFAGTKDAVFTEIIDIEARLSTTISSPLDTKYDAMRGGEYVSSGFLENYYYLNMNNVRFESMKFSGPRGRIFVYNLNPYNKYKNFEVVNCEFNTTEPGKDNMHEELDGIKSSACDAVVYFETHYENVLENFVFKNNTVTGHYQGIFVTNAKNYLIANNTFTNLNSIAISVQYTSIYNSNFTGEVVIVNNTIDTTGVGIATAERAIRFGGGENTNILVAGNTFTNCAEDRTADNEGVQLLKSQTLTNGTYTFVNNTYGGEAMENFKGNDSTFIVYIEEPVA